MDNESRSISPENLFELPPHERLRRIACAAYPDRVELRTIAIGTSVRSAWQALIAATRVGPWELAATVGKQIEVPVADNLAHADPAVTRLVPEGLARAHLIVPLRMTDGRLAVACAFPLVGGGIRRVAFVANHSLVLHIAPPEEIETAISSAYHRAAERQSGRLGELLFPGPAATAPDADVPDSAVVALGRRLVRYAIEAGASDLHIQPFSGGGLVRIRVDGVLRRLAHLPGAVLPMLIRYVKAQGGMDSTNERIAQDGRLSIVLEDRDFDVRISALPASRGESLVMRFLDQRRVYRLSRSGFSHAGLQAMRRLVSNTAGMVLVTGPTGSGKTSTLYAMLAEINRIGVNIITVENPVEYRVAGIAQVEVNAKAGLTFASALRSILRQDPDVILIGEIRDRETAEIAVQAALTGHLVLSTLHTNDALTAIPRLLDFGTEPSVLADALVGVVAQRLFRRLCARCRAPVAEPLLPEERILLEATGQIPTHRVVGCADCAGSGYSGRIPVVEIVERNPALLDLISSGNRNLDALRQTSQGQLDLMSRGALRRILSGDTTVREAVRVIGQRFWTDLARVMGRPTPPEALRLFQGDDGSAGDPLLLLFDRDPASARAIAAALEAQHFRVVVASDPDETRSLLEREPDVSLLVIDFDPGAGEDAMPLAQRLRAALAWARLPFVPIVREQDAELRKGLEEIGVSEYLVKPMTPEEIARRVRAAYMR
jgi:type II secretory ATPase GspE/PulE/Tfp pilus assembly ATPase PilB-like protein